MNNSLDKTTKSKLQEKGDGSTCAFGLFTKNKKVLTGLREYDTATVWVLPGGRSEKGENIKETLSREIEEETGINDTKIKEFFGEFEGIAEGDKVYVFLCETNQKPELKEPDKFKKWEWKDVKDFNDKFLNENIFQAVRSYLD